MPKQAPRLTGTNVNDFIIDFSAVDFSQYGGQQAQPQPAAEEASFWDKAANSGKAIAEGLLFVPGQIADTVRDAYHGGDIDVTDTQALQERRASEQERAEYVQKYKGKTFEGLPDAMTSMGYSLGTMGASIGAGMLAAPAGPVAAGAAGMAASGTLAYRASKQQFLQQMLGETEKALGRMPTQEEWDRVAVEFDGEATRYGAWEAGPEALSNLFMAKILGPLGKGLLRGGVGQGVKRVGGLYGEELATETITQMGQGQEEASAGLRDKAPGMVEAFKEVAPATFWQTTLMAGGKKSADVIANRMLNRANGADSEKIEDTPPQTDAEHLALPAGGQRALPEAPIRMGTDQTGYGPMPMGGRSEDIPDGRSSTQLALDRGDTIDLLALPGFSQGISALPEGTGAIPMGMDSTGRPAIAPKTDFSTPITTPYTERQALPQQAGPSAGEGRWSGGRSQLAYGNGGMMQGLGFVGGQSSPHQVSPAPAMPTQAQITATQRGPRADTTAQADMLGVPSPEASPAEARQNGAAPVLPQQVSAPQQATAADIMPIMNEGAGMPGQDAALVQQDTAVPQDVQRSKRAELLQQLPPDQRKDARRLTTPQIAERVRAAQDSAPQDAQTGIAEQEKASAKMSDVLYNGGIEDIRPGNVFLNYRGEPTKPVPVGRKNISAWLKKEAENSVSDDAEMLSAVKSVNGHDGFYMEIISGEHLQKDFRETYNLPDPGVQNSDNTPHAGYVEKAKASPQVEPNWSYGLPSFVTEPHKQILPEQTATKKSRAELLKDLPPERRKDARRMTNAEIKKMVHAEQNPVRFSADSIEYTVEDYPMPTAPGGTVFTSASGRRMSPFPQVDYSTNKKHKASNAKVAEWLLNEARKEAEPNEWRSLMIRHERADNLSPASVDDLVDILSSGVETETIPPQLKLPPPREGVDARKDLEPTEEAARPKDEPALQDGPQKDEAPASAPAETKGDLAAHFASQFLNGKNYANIGQARREATGISGEKFAAGTTAVKIIDENIELGIIKAARGIISTMRKSGASDLDIYKRMVQLYQQQPNLSVRTSTSMAQQAYSTPAPLAFLASHLAGITNETTVYEPTAGNGMLLMAALPQKSTANELNAGRAERLRSLGFTVNQGDATEFLPKSEVDVVIANPPFGRMRDDSGTPLSWDVAGYETKELDHAIALKALEAIQPQGRAVIIIGGKQGNDTTRSAKYQATAQRQFYRALFDNYKVIDHFTVDGKMYEKQGAGYPVDFIVIDGKGYTDVRKFPAANLPRIYDNFQSLEELIDEQRPAIHEGMDAERRGRLTEDSGVRGGRGNKESVGSHEPAVSVGVSSDTELHTGRSGRSGRSSEQNGDVQPGTERGQAGRSGLRADRHSADGGRQLSRTPEQQDGPVRDRVSKQDGGEQGRVARPSSPESERLVGGDGNTVSGKLVEKNQPQQITQKATALQEPYTPHSASTAMGTLVPRNMASPLKAALEDLEARRGDIDSYVGSELGYSPKELKQYFAGEQIDAIGLAIDNLSKGSGFIIGDQTGIGKGRVNAGIIRYARQKGLIPVFVTMKPDLYADMIRDLNDIGETSFNPLPTNAGLTGEKAIPLPDGRKLRTKARDQHSDVLAKAADNGVADFDAVFTTYDQLNPGKTEERRNFMMNIAPRALFILDESHNAGGSDSGQKRKGKEAQQSRAAFVREMLSASPHGVFYSSATYAKRPDVMSLYFKTDMRHAVDDIGALSDAISAGGIPLQQVVAAQLTESGQYIRRERSFEGASVEVTAAKADLNHAEQSATIMRGILAFDKVKQLAMKEKAAEAMAQGEAVGDSSATGEKGANSTNFTSIMHNLIGQSLLGMKAQAAIDEAAAAVERGEKPVLTLANTMGSFIAEHVQDNDVKAGQELSLSFKDLFRRYLDKTRTLTRKGSNNKVIESRLLTDGELGPDGVAAYRAAVEAIDDSIFADLPISPIDFITTELESKGISVGEITGRNHAVEYRDGTPYYRTRKTSSAQNIETMRKFNNGELDAIILNQSGSTGISLHSSSTFTDQRKRTMIIVQPELNIDVFMQTLGRVFRTGQVTPPAYKLLSSDIPAEKRPAAVLGKKMAGLNANTTASRKTDTTFQNIPDFLNQYGDAVAAQIMEEDPELHAALGNPLSNGEKGLSREDAVRKVTGRIPMLPLKEQQELYERIESEYTALIAQLEATGGSALEAKTLALDAKLIESHELTPAKEGGEASVFGAASRVGIFDVKILGKPYTPEQVSAMVEKGKENAPDIAALRTNTREWLQKKMESIENEETKGSLRSRTEEQFSRVSGIIESLPVGEPVTMSTIDTVFDGIVTRVEYKGKGNPSAPSAWRMTVAVADAAKQVTIPFSKLSTDGGEISIGGAHIRANRQSVASTLEKFSRGQTAKREKRYIAFGNVLAAYASAGNNGQVVNFEDSDGNVRPGILFKRDSSLDSILGASAVSFPDYATISAFFDATKNRAIVKSADGNLVLSTNGDKFKVSVPASKAKGAQFFLNGKLLAAAGQDFVKSGNFMVVTVDKNAAEKMVGVLREQGYGLVAGSHKEEARTVMGLDANKPLASLVPMAFLPKDSSRRTARRESIERVAEKLGERAKHAAPVRVVASATELPEGIRRQYADSLDTIEGVYDPRSKSVWLVADNLSSETRAAEVWTHEQFVHHGLRGLFTDAERKRLLGQLWISLGGMRNQAVREVAELYGLDPRSDVKARLTVMEEVVASMAEKRALDNMTPQEMTVWKRIVSAVLRAWSNLVSAVSGRSGSMGFENVDQLLSYLGEYVMDGKMSHSPEGSIAEGALSSLRTSRPADTDDAPLASLGSDAKSVAEIMRTVVSGENLAAGVRTLRKVLGRGVSEDVEDILRNPEIGKMVGTQDMGLMERLFKLPHWVAKDHAAFAKVYERQTQRVEERSAALKKSLEQIPLLYDPEKKNRLNSREMAELRDMIWKWDGKEIPELKDVEKFIVKGTTLNGRSVLEINPDFYPAYEQWLTKQPESERVQQAFLQVRKSLDADFLKAYAKMASMSDLADTDLEMYRTSFGSIHNYFPHQRIGKYYVTATEGKGVAGDPKLVVFRRHFDVPLGSSVREEWAKIVAAHKKEFPRASWHSPREAEKLPEDILGAPIDASAIEQIITSATEKLGKGEQAAEVRSVLLSGVSDILKTRGFGAHGIKRQSIPGHDTENILGILYSYKAGLNGWLTKMEAAADFAAALGKIDAKKTPRLWEYASQYSKDMLRNSDKVDRIVGNIKTFAFAGYLGANLKTAAVNATQNFIIGIPRLQTYVAGGSGLWIKSAMDTVGLHYSNIGVTGAKRLKADELRLIQELFGDGVINDAYMEEVRGQLGDAPGAKVWNRFVKFMGMPMSIVERFNRASLALAAYRAARAGAFREQARREFGLKPDERMDYEQAKTFSSMLVRDSHYVLDKGNQPELFRSSVAGRILSPAYTFRSFGANTLNLYYRALRHEGAAGMAFVAKSLGATIALGGLTTFPFYATMAALCQSLGGDDEGWTEKIRKHLPQSNLLRDIVCYGTPAIFGVSIGGSLRMETPLTEGFKKGATTPKEIFQESIGDIIGIPYDMVINRTSKFFEALGAGNHDRMVEAIVPTFVANMMQAWRLYSEGQTTMTGRPINDPGKRGARKLSGGDAVGKFLGFQPVSSTKSYDAYAAGKHASQVRSDKIDELTVLALKTVDTGKQGGHREMLNDMREWNEKMKREGKPHMLINYKDVMRRVKARRRENRVNAKTRQQRARQQEVWG